VIKVSELSEALIGLDQDANIDWISKPEEVTFRQIQAAKVFLSWSNREVIEKSGVSSNTVWKILRGDSVRHYSKYKVIKCMVNNGIIFVEDGVFYNKEETIPETGEKHEHE
jgi:hypothetical protein